MLIRFALAFALLVSVSRPGLAQESQESALAPIIDLLKQDDKEFRSLALEMVRAKANSKAETETFAAVLPSLKPDAQVGLITALAERGDKAARPQVQALMSGENEAVRVAAIKAMGSLGESEDLPALVRCLEKDAAEEQAARVCLTQLTTDGITTELAKQLQSQSPKVCVALVEILTSRRAKDTIPQIMKLVTSADESKRRSAMKSLGEIASPMEHVSGMVRGVLSAQSGKERVDAERALMFTCNRISEKNERAVPLLDAMYELSRTERLALYPTLGRVGGWPARRSIETAIRSWRKEEHDAGMKAIANWPNASIANRLIELAKKDKHGNHRNMALKALIRVAPLNDDRTPMDRLALLKTAMEMCSSDADRNYVLRRTSAVRIPETLRFVLPYVDKPTFAKQACLTVVELSHHRNLREPNKEEFHAALDKVIAIAKDPVVIDRANRYKSDQTWVRPK